MSNRNLPPDLERVQLPQGTITYRVAGPTGTNKPVVVFVHGLLVDNQLWTKAADALAQRGVRSYAPNWPTGSHPIPMNADADLSPRGIARIVIDFLSALDLTNVTLVGNDTGGAICQYVIDTDHSRIDELVLTNCDAFDVFPPKEFDALITIGSHAALIKPMLTALRLTTARHAHNVYGGTFAGSPDPQITRSWIEPGLRSRGVRRDAAKLISSIDPQDLLDVSTRFGTFTKPVRLVWGDADSFFSGRVRAQTRRRLPKFEAHTRTRRPYVHFHGIPRTGCRRDHGETVRVTPAAGLQLNAFVISGRQAQSSHVAKGVFI